MMGLINDINEKVVPRVQELLSKGMYMNDAIVQAFKELGYIRKGDKDDKSI